MHQVLEGTDASNASETRKKLVEIMTSAPSAAEQHPRVEHLIPLHVAFGAAFPSAGEPAAQVKRIYSEMVLGTMSLDSYIFI